MPCRHDGVLLQAVVACWRRRLAHHWRTVLSISAGLTLAVAGCATPIRVARVDPREVERQLDSNVISTHHLSEATRIVLYRANLLERFDTDPEGAIASLHRTITAGPADPDMLFALAEMSFLHTGHWPAAACLVGGGLRLCFSLPRGSATTAERLRSALAHGVRHRELRRRLPARAAVGPLRHAAGADHERLA